MGTLEKQIQSDLETLKEVLSHIDLPDAFDPRLIRLSSIVESDETCYVTVAASAIKIRSASGERLAKIDAQFTCDFCALEKRFITGLFNRDVAYLFLLALQANGKFDIVKFDYKGSTPLAKEAKCISNLRDEMLSSMDGPGKIQLGTLSVLIDGVANVPNNPKADFAFTINHVPSIFISHKDNGNKQKLANSFRQYGGLSKFSLGELSNHEEILELKAELQKGFSAAGFSLSSMRKGSYFAKRIESDDLIKAAIFGRNYDSCVASIHNVDALIQGDIVLADVDGIFNLQCSHLLVHPRHNNGELIIQEEFAPHFMIMKSQNTNQWFNQCRLSIWPKNDVTLRGISNFKTFFVDGEYEKFHFNK